MRKADDAEVVEKDFDKSNKPDSKMTHSIVVSMKRQKFEAQGIILEEPEADEYENS